MKVIGGYDPRDKYSIKLEDNHFNEEVITNRNEIRLGLPKNYDEKTLKKAYLN